MKIDTTSGNFIICFYMDQSPDLDPIKKIYSVKLWYAHFSIPIFNPLQNFERAKRKFTSYIAFLGSGPGNLQFIKNPIFLFYPFSPPIKLYCSNLNKT